MSIVNISLKAEALLALVEELGSLEAQQMEVGAQMAALLDIQFLLSRKCRLIHKSLKEIHDSPTTE